MTLSKTSRLWTIAIGIPILFLIDLQLSYSLMEMVCTTGHFWPQYLSTLVAAALIAFMGWYGWGARETDDPSLRFLAWSGAALAPLFVLAELALLVTKIFLVRCSG